MFFKHFPSSLLTDANSVARKKCEHRSENECMRGTDAVAVEKNAFTLFYFSRPVLAKTAKEFTRPQRF